MATPKYRGLKLGPGGLNTLVDESEIFVENYTPTDGVYPTGDGKDGDLWIQVSGASSSVYQKANNAWISLSPNFSGAGIALTDSATNALAFSYTAASYKVAIIDYYIITVTGEIERGEFNVVNDGIDAVGSQFNVNEINGPLGIDFDFVINGADVEVRYDSSATPLLRVLFYRLRS